MVLSLLLDLLLNHERLTFRRRCQVFLNALLVPFLLLSLFSFLSLLLDSHFCLNLFLLFLFFLLGFEDGRLNLFFFNLFLLVALSFFLVAENLGLLGVRLLVHLFRFNFDWVGALRSGCQLCSLAIVECIFILGEVLEDIKELLLDVLLFKLADLGIVSVGPQYDVDGLGPWALLIIHGVAIA